MGVNIGSSPAFLLGLFLAVAGAGLFFLRSIRPELARDYDIFFAAVGLLCGIILIFNGWRLDPILAFCQFMLTGTAIFFAFDSIRMRGVATEQARRNTETVDRDRPVSRTRVYTEAELDKFDSYDNNVYEGAKPNYNSPRLRGYDDPQPRNTRRSEPRRRPAPTSDFQDDSRRPRSRNRPPSGDDYNRRSRSDDRSYPDRDSHPNRSRRRPAPENNYDDWDTQDEWNDNPPRNTSRPSRRPTRENRYDSPVNPAPTTPKNSKPTPPDLANLGRSYDEPEEGFNSPNAPGDYVAGNNYDEPEESIPGDYVVDYQPLEDPGSDYSDGYEDDYDNEYDNSQSDDYDDYRDEPETRKPINFE